ncbi:MAG: FecR domain-containing protein [Bacteriovorax sp.]|nr:FecR domain-containing protein [Bacteriovorax sp.]
MKFKTLFTSIFLSLVIITSAHAEFMPVANVSKIQGKAFINKEQIKVGAEIAERMELVIPKAGDFVEVKFQNGHLIRFTGATVKVETLNPKNTLFNLLRGKLYSAIKPLTQNETFEVKTKRVAFAVRGTHFMIEETKKQSYLCVCEGVVSAKSATGEVKVNKDEDLSLATPKSELKATVAAKSMINMTNVVFKDMGVL